MTATLDHRLVSDPHILAIIPAEPLIVPELDLSRFPKEKHDMVDKMYSTIERLIRRPYIIDTFTDHEARRVWKTAIHDSHGIEAYDKLNGNALRANSANALLSGAELLFASYQGESGEAHRIMSDLKRMAATHFHSYTHQAGAGTPQTVYDTLPVHEKVKVMADMKQMVCSILYEMQEKERAVEAVHAIQDIAGSQDMAEAAA